MNENLTIESSEPSVIDVDDKFNDHVNFEVCPGHLIVNITDCMNINAYEHDGSLYIYENYVFSNNTNNILYTILAVLVIFILADIVYLYFDSDSEIALIGLFSAFAILMLGWIIIL